MVPDGSRMVPGTVLTGAGLMVPGSPVGSLQGNHGESGTITCSGRSEREEPTSNREPSIPPSMVSFIPSRRPVRPSGRPEVTNGRTPPWPQGTPPRAFGVWVGGDGPPGVSLPPPGRFWRGSLGTGSGVVTGSPVGVPGGGSAEVLGPRAMGGLEAQLPRDVSTQKEQRLRPGEPPQQVLCARSSPLDGFSRNPPYRLRRGAPRGAPPGAARHGAGECPRAPRGLKSGFEGPQGRRLERI